jgi:hypothetical protein
MDADQCRSLFLRQKQGSVVSIAGYRLLICPSAIQESFVWLGLTTTQANSYISGNATYPDVVLACSWGWFTCWSFLYSSTKWFALNSIAPYEIWTDWRRTGVVYGVVVVLILVLPFLLIQVHQQVQKIHSFIIRRMNIINPTNVSAEGTINVTTSRIFWDLN